LASSPEAQHQLTELLTQCFDALKVYGKEPEQVVNLIKVFVMVLGDYTFEQVHAAFRTYLKQSNELPAPSDIVKIIEPPPPVYSSAMYVQIKKNLREGNVFVTDEEKAYVRAYEKQELAKVRGGTERYRDAQSQLEDHRLAMAHD